MSRKIKELEDGSVIAYGYDRPTSSYFFQKYAAEPDEDGEDVLLIDEDSYMTNMTNGKMLELMSTYEVDDRDISHVALDLPIPQSYE